MPISDAPESIGARARAAGLWGALAYADERLTGARPALFTILVLCFALRLGLGWFVPSIHQADEIYQVSEQANRRLHGYGVESWEFRTRSRAAILPALVEPIYALPVSAGMHELLEDALFTALSLIPVWIAFEWAGRLYGLRGAIAAAVMMGTWFELVYFAPKATVDAVCSYFLIAAVFCARPRATERTVLAGGILLILTLAIRVQTAPVVALLLLIALLAHRRTHRAALIAGAIVGLAATGAVGWAWWGRPFQGQIGYLTMEFVHHASRSFGRQPFLFYVKEYALDYGLALPLIVALVLFGARKAPILLVAAAAVILPFQFVGHKEYRFLIAGLPLLVLLMGLAAAELIVRVNRLLTRGSMAALLACWIIAMVAASYGDHYRPYWERSRNVIVAFRAIGRDPGACGVGLIGLPWWQTPGEAGLGRDIPIYDMGREGENSPLLPSANYVMVSGKAAPPSSPYVLSRTYTRPFQRLYRRAGNCVPNPEARVEFPPAIPGVQ